VLPAAFYELDGERVRSTELTRGPWDRGHQHAGPPAALLARAIEGAAGIRPGQAVRLTFDILRPVPIAPLRIETRTLRPGRRVEQLEAVLADEDGAALMRATAWRMQAQPVALPVGAGAPDPPPPPPEGARVPEMRFWTDDVAYHRALRWRFVEGDFETPGPATCWTHLDAALVAGHAPSPLERLIVMADAASGISAALSWTEWSFVNIDLGIHLERLPEGEWMAMAARTRLGPAGSGQCTSVLYDARGRVGSTTHALLVSPRTPAR
jgi:hypothetical protein